jgi:3-oxoacyl-[acyl-carrier-protein] synthase-1
MPGSANTSMPDQDIPVHYLLATQSAAVDIAMNNAFGFGGTNCSLLLGRARS